MLVGVVLAVGGTGGGGGCCPHARGGGPNILTAGYGKSKVVPMLVGVVRKEQ